MRVLGLDPSLTNYGWALHDTKAEGGKRCLSRGRFQTGPRDFPDEVGRYQHLRECLREKILELGPDTMGIEHPVFNEDYSEGMYALFMFSLDAIKECHQDIVFFAPPQVKKFAKDILERPKAWKMAKSDMVEAAREHAGGGRWDHNEADAYLVGALSGRFWDFYTDELHEDELTPYEKKTFTLIRTITKGKRAGRTEIKGILHREGERFFLWSVGVEG
jgi:Holliday junction resolvasome RuvABC endonuclease subunit